MNNDTIYDTIEKRMSKKEKAIAKIRQNPKNVRFEEIETVLSRLGFVKRQEGSSHAVFTLGKHRLTVSHRKPFVKPVYIKQLLEELDRIQELDEPDED